jgi:hypothetical protein
MVHPPCKYLCIHLGAGNTMVPSKLTGGVDGAGGVIIIFRVLELGSLLTLTNPTRRYAEKKLRSWKNFGLSRPFFWQKLGTWVLLSTVFVEEKVPSGQSKNIRYKTLDLRPSYLFYIQYVLHPSTYAGFSTCILNFYLRPTVNYSNECHFLLKSPTSVGIK